MCIPSITISLQHIIWAAQNPNKPAKKRRRATKKNQDATNPILNEANGIKKWKTKYKYIKRKKQVYNNRTEHRTRQETLRHYLII